MIVRNCASSDKDRTPDGKFTNIATTLMARDYKGLSNYGSNAVIECKKCED